MHISKSDSKNRDVGEALVAGKSTRRNRNSGGGKGGKGVSNGTAADKDSQSSSSKDAGKKYEDMRNKCHRCLEPQRRWCECTAHVVPAPKESQDGSGSMNGRLLISMETSM